MHKLLTIIAVLIAPGLLYAGGSDRFITKLKLPSGQTVVVAEAEYEAQSIGSFSIRMYDCAPPADETTFFRAGLIQARDGTIEKVILANVLKDRHPEIVVIIRAAGTGGYLSAHAFVIDKQHLSLGASLQGLPPNADPIEALKQSNLKR